jgi:hypothetical protein
VIITERHCIIRAKTDDQIICLKNLNGKAFLLCTGGRALSMAFRIVV